MTEIYTEEQKRNSEKYYEKKMDKLLERIKRNHEEMGA